MICVECKKQEQRDIAHPATETPVKVVVCGPDMVHYPLTFIACCDDAAEEYALDFAYKFLGEFVEVAEAWWEGDTQQTGPSSTWYPQNHIGHPMTPNLAVAVGA